MKIATFLVLLVCSCTSKEKSDLNKIAKLPKQLKEISGIAIANNFLYAIQDSGNKSEIVVLDTLGTLLNTIKVNNVSNTDWEDVTLDQQGNVYIGDFGNNDNIRKDLAIYKIPSFDLLNNNVNATYKVTFDYPEQIDFPPSKKRLMFDVEAFFEYGNFFYLFTKNRSKKFDGSSYIYKIPNQAGHHHAVLLDTIYTGNDYNTCAITSASISPNKTKFVLLSHAKIWVFAIPSDKSIAKAIPIEINLNHNSQKEAIFFKNDSILYIADEKVKKSGGNLYKWNLNTKT